MACRNPELARLRTVKRKDLIAATERELQKIAGMVASGKLERRDRVGVRVGKVIGRYKVGKHFDLDIQDATLSFSVNEERVAALAKTQNRRLADGTPALSFRGLLTHLATIVRNTMRPRDAMPGIGTFTLTTEANPKQRQALNLAAAITA